MNGTIRKLNETFGFIARPNHPDVFFSAKNVAADGFDGLVVGDSVAFAEIVDRDRVCASNVRKVDPLPLERGVVATVSDAFGFISRPGERDIYFLVSHALDPDLRVGDEVLFNLGWHEHHQRPYAVAIRRAR